MNAASYDVKTKWCNLLAAEVLFKEGEKPECLKDNACLHAGQCQNVSCQWVDGKGNDPLRQAENEYEM